MAVSVQHWRVEDGETCPNPTMTAGQGRLDPPPRGWYCWVYTDDHNGFIEWMEQNCPSSDCTSRFNSGNPMVTTYIKEDKEATLFQLKWL
jgi:hypothetical protein